MQVQYVLCYFKTAVTTGAARRRLKFAWREILKGEATIFTFFQAHFFWLSKFEADEETKKVLGVSGGMLPGKILKVYVL